MDTRHQLVTDYGYTLSDIDSMFVYEFEITNLMIIQNNKAKEQRR